MGFESLLDPVLGWVLTMPLWLGILILSLSLTLIINLVYRMVTDQNEMKRIKTQLKKYQKEMKEHRSDQKKMMEYQQKAMSLNSQYMMKSMKPTLFTLLPLLIIFAWMSANLSYAIVDAGEPVEVVAFLNDPATVELVGQDITLGGDAVKDTVEQQVSWVVKAPAGEQTLRFVTDAGAEAEQLLVVGSRPYDASTKQDNIFDKTEVRYEKAKPFGSFSIFGYQPGWLFTYILFSIVFSIATRRLMGIY